MVTTRLGPVGIWASILRDGEPFERRDAAAELEELGFHTLWFPGGVGGDVFGVAASLLEATRSVTIGTGVLNVWMHTADEVAASHRELTCVHPGRFMLGVGIGHKPVMAQVDVEYTKPLQTMGTYLDQLDDAAPPVPVGERMVAALGPKMLELARDRSAGSHPFLVSPEHTAAARQVLGVGPLLAPEQGVVMEVDPLVARNVGRRVLAPYLNLPNYTNNWLRSGFTSDDLEHGGSDRLIDSLFAWGGLERVATRIREHLAAGADHVCLQVLTDERAVFPRQQWRELASVLSSIV